MSKCVPKHAFSIIFLNNGQSSDNIWNIKSENINNITEFKLFLIKRQLAVVAHLDESAAFAVAVRTA